MDSLNKLKIVFTATSVGGNVYEAKTEYVLRDMSVSLNEIREKILEAMEESINEIDFIRRVVKEE